jgi:hypothetical protein
VALIVDLAAALIVRCAGVPSHPINAGTPLRHMMRPLIDGRTDMEEQMISTVRTHR